MTMLIVGDQRRRRNRVLADDINRRRPIVYLATVRRRCHGLLITCGRSPRQKRIVFFLVRSFRVELNIFPCHGNNRL